MFFPFEGDDPGSIYYFQRSPNKIHGLYFRQVDAKQPLRRSGATTG